jgi:bacterioferritin
MTYWTPAYNKYPRKICDVIANSIKAEEGAIKKYRKQSETICDANIVSILKRIILDEERHIEIFRSMIDRCC